MYPEAQMAALLTAFQMRSILWTSFIGFPRSTDGDTPSHRLRPYRPIDIVGTGGDGKNTFNISTCACFRGGGSWLQGCQRSNHGATSVSGASNVIEQRGVRFTNNPGHAGNAAWRSATFTFMPSFQSAMKFVGPVQDVGSAPCSICSARW